MNRCSAIARWASRAIRCGAPPDNCARPSPSACRASHADLLADPEVDPTGRRIDWYAPFEGQPRKLAELDDSERQAILSDVHRLHGEITGLADSMDEPQRSTAERNFARLLRHALTAPGEDTLYVVDGKPGGDLLGLLGRRQPARRLPGEPASLSPRAPPFVRSRCPKP